MRAFCCWDARNAEPMTERMRMLRADAFDRLAASFTGDIIRPSDERYDEARRVWNAMIDRRPASSTPMRPSVAT